MEQQAAEELQSVLSCADPLREQSLSYLLGMFCECLEVSEVGVCCQKSEGERKLTVYF